MTDEQIRVAIAEACGFTNVHQVEQSSMHNALWVGIAPGSLSDITFPLPDYPNDLNAMHSAEETLQICDSGRADCQWQRYWSELDTGPAGCVGRKNLLHLTARQKAEAFLRVLGKWTE